MGFRHLAVPVRQYLRLRAPEGVRVRRIHVIGWRINQGPHLQRSAIRPATATATANAILAIDFHHREHREHRGRDSRNGNRWLTGP